MKTYNISHWFFWFLVLLIVSCEKEKDKEIIPDTRIVNREVYSLMQEMYLWNDELPEINPDDYGTPEQVMDALRYEPLDRWSYVMSKTEFEQYFERGEMAGHGFLIGLDANGNLRIAFVYKNTQAYREGIRRTWQIIRVNNSEVTPNNIFDLLGASDEGITNNITFRLPDGTEKSLELTKELLSINAVIHYEIIQYEGSTIGYMVFQDFIATSIEEIDQVFQSFVNANVDELIIDLRYNGGGSVEVAEHISGWIAGKNHTDDVLYKLKHNENNSYRDAAINFPANPEALDPDRVFFITASGTASASELLINGLKPVYDIILSGIKTHGKPVGMYAFSFNDYDYTVLPVSFKYVNANDQGDFYDGIVPDLQAPDDLTKPFGDPDEPMLKAVLDYISGATIKNAYIPHNQKILLPAKRGIYEVRRAY